MRLSIEQTGAIVPPPSLVLNKRAEVWRDVRGQVSAYAEVRGEDYWIHLPGLASFRFSTRGDEVGATLAKSVREEIVLDAYRRKVLPMALQVRGREVLHASAVLSPAGVVVLSGLSESGKSTIAFGFSRRGYPLWADDMVAFEISREGASAVSLPFNIRLRPASAALFEVDSNRTPLTDCEIDTSVGPETQKLAAICVLRRVADSKEPVVVRRLASAEALGAVLDHVCCFIPQDDDRKRRMIHHYLELIATVPIFDICYQTGLENLPRTLDAIEELLQETARPAVE